VEIGVKKCKFEAKKRFFVITSNPYINAGLSDHKAKNVIVSVILKNK
jgi:hypothetical protein